MSQQHLDYKQMEMETARRGGDSAGPQEGETSTAAPYTSSAKSTSSPSSLCVRSNATVVGEGERLEALARGGVLPSCTESISTRGEPIRRHIK